MSFKLPDLPYGYDALEPSVDAQTMQVLALEEVPNEAKIQ